MKPHPVLKPLADRLRKLGHANLAHELSGLGGVLCSEGSAPWVLEQLVASAEREADLRRQLDAAAVASGIADLRGEVESLRAKLGGGR